MTRQMNKGGNGDTVEGRDARDRQIAGDMETPLYVNEIRP